MTRDEIIGMAREAGFGFMTEKPKSATHMQCGIDDLERFAELVAAHEQKKFCATLRQIHDAISLASRSGELKIWGAHD